MLIKNNADNIIMNLRDLQYLVALSTLKHFGKAAQACCVSQPALSMQIKKLEETLGVVLIERTKKFVLLTQSGEIIVERVKRILQELDEIKAIAQASKDIFKGELRLGIFPTLAPYWLPQIMPQLFKKFPHISFYLIEEPSERLIHLLKAGKIHATFLAEPVTEKELKHEKVFSEEFLLATAVTNPLSVLSVIQPSDLLHEKLWLLNAEHCLRNQTLEICHKMNLQENNSFQATSLETLRHMVASGMGSTLMPKLACHPTQNVVYIPFDHPTLTRNIALYWRKSSSQGVLLDAIAKFISHYSLTS